MNPKQAIALTLLSVGALTAGGWFAFSGTKEQAAEVASTGPVREENGTQVISVHARGGYTPRTINAAADKPSRLEMITEGTYDCSSAFTIPTLSYRTFLPSTGVTNIDIPPQPKGTDILGVCSMGMYSFTMHFE